MVITVATVILINQYNFYDNRGLFVIEPPSVNHAMEKKSIDLFASRMQSARSTIWATSPAGTITVHTWYGQYMSS